MISAPKISKAQRQVPPRGCMFCDGRPLTEEHFWSDWLRRRTPRSTNSHVNFRTSSRRVAGTHVIEPRLTKRAGHSLSRVLKVVCAPCNQGWMRDIEEAARPYLADLIDGNDVTLNEGAQAALTHWIALKTIVGEMDDPASRAITEAEARAFYETRSLDPSWRIWIGRYGGTARQYNYRHLNARAVHRLIAQMFDGNIAPNTQATTFIPGRLLIHSFCSSNSMVRYDFSGPAQAALRRIYPVEQAFVHWTSTPPISDEATAIISDALLHMFPRGPHVLTQPKS